VVSLGPSRKAVVRACSPKNKQPAAGGVEHVVRTLGETEHKLNRTDDSQGVPLPLARAECSAARFSQMFSPVNKFFEIIGDLALTLFDGGPLSHQQRAAEQALKQASAEYRSVVLAAFQNVADTLHAIHSDAAHLKAVVETEQAARVTLELARAQQELGEVDTLTLLQAEEAYQQATLTLIEAQAARLGSTATLFQALGGGWWNRIE